jgi:replicative DNA helicase
LNGPHDLHAEQAVIGAALFDARAYEIASLRPAHFYDPCHGALWEEIGARRRGDRLCDATALKEWANNHAGLKELGGAAYLMRLMDAAAPLSAQVAGYGEMLREMAQRRAVIEAAKAAIDTAATGPGALPALEQRLFEIAAADIEADAWGHAGERVMDAVERAELGEARGISTGLPGLDDVTGGLKPGLWVIGGATSMGKSIIGAAIARAVAAQGYGVGEHHLEMTDIQVGLRTASALAFNKDPRAQDDNPHYLSAMRGKLRPPQWAALRGAAKASVHLPIYVDTRPGRSVSQIEAASRRLIRRFQREGIAPGCILIDHEGLIAAEPGQRFPSQLERTNARSEALMAMAKRLGVCVIALSQITKEGARADGDERLPTLLDLNYGGAISQAADVVILIHRRAYYEERKPAHLRNVERLLSKQATLVVDKTRDGRRSHVTVYMDMPTAAVWEAAA